MQRFDGDVDPNLLAVLETIGDGLGHAIHADWNAVHNMLFDSGGACVTGKAHDAKGEIANGRRSRLSIDGDPDLRWVLRSQFMEAKRRKQADDRVRNARACESEHLVLAELRAGGDVQASSAALKLSGALEPTEGLT
jgi:hypothetical protein